MRDHACWWSGAAGRSRDTWLTKHPMRRYRACGPITRCKTAGAAGVAAPNSPLSSRSSPLQCLDTPFTQEPRQPVHAGIEAQHSTPLEPNTSHSTSLQPPNTPRRATQHPQRTRPRHDKHLAQELHQPPLRLLLAVALRAEGHGAALEAGVLRAAAAVYRGGSVGGRRLSGAE